MATIYIPKTISELIELSEKIIERHYLEAENSPLGNIDMEAFRTNLDVIREKYRRHMELKEKSDRIKEEIQMALGIHRTHKSIPPSTIRFVIVQVRDILKAVNRERMEELGTWGYVLY